jgi:hypothetical protein
MLGRRPRGWIFFVSDKVLRALWRYPRVCVSCSRLPALIRHKGCPDREKRHLCGQTRPPANFALKQEKPWPVVPAKLKVIASDGCAQLYSLGSAVCKLFNRFSPPEDTHTQLRRLVAPKHMAGLHQASDRPSTTFLSAATRKHIPCLHDEFQGYFNHGGG